MMMTPWIDATCPLCGGPLSRWGWFAEPDEPVLYVCCIRCMIDDAVGLAAIWVIPKERS